MIGICRLAVAIHTLIIYFLYFSSRHCELMLMLLWQSIRVAEKITQKVEGQLSKSQKEYLLRQQVGFVFALGVNLRGYTLKWYDSGTCYCR